MRYYLLMDGQTLVNVYTEIPPTGSYPSRFGLLETRLDPPPRPGQRLVNGNWLEPLPPPAMAPPEEWQTFMDKLDGPERGGNGGYALALSGPAVQHAMQAYTLVILFTKRIAGERERLTLFYHLNEIMRLEPTTAPLIAEAMTAGNIVPYGG